MDSHVVRGHSIAWDIRREGRTDDRFIVKMSDISDNDVQDGVFVGGLGDNLAEARANIQKMFDVKIILVPTTEEGTVWERGFELEIVHSYMFNKFGLLFAAGRRVERAEDYLFYGARGPGFDKTPADFKILWNMDGKLRECKLALWITQSDRSTTTSPLWPRI